MRETFKLPLIKIGNSIEDSQLGPQKSKDAQASLPRSSKVARKQLVDSNPFSFEK